LLRTIHVTRRRLNVSLHLVRKACDLLLINTRHLLQIRDYFKEFSIHLSKPGIHRCQARRDIGVVNGASGIPCLCCRSN
jgi:hypothetical protein